MTEENGQRKELEMHGASREDSRFDVEVKAAKLLADRGGGGGSGEATCLDRRKETRGNGRRRRERRKWSMTD